MRLGASEVLALFAMASLVMSAVGQATAGADTGCATFTMRAAERTVHTLANGTTITRESTRIEAQDSAGRRLTVTRYARMRGEEEQSGFSVYDPVARTTANWISPGASKVVTVSPMTPLKPGQVVSTCLASGYPRKVKPATASPPLAKTSQRTDPKTGTTRITEDLGTQVIQGVDTYGVRYTTTIASGANGNDAPLVSTDERWVSPSLGIVMREVTDDPQAGHHTIEVEELSLGEPDPAIFQPPPDYEIEIVVQERHPVSQQP